LRLVFANLRSSRSLIDFAILRDGPFSDDFALFPRLAASAAPAAICCFFDFAGIHKDSHAELEWIGSGRSKFAPEEVNRYAGQHDQDSNSRRFRCKECKIDNEQAGEQN
jgi:hypothetical protein